MGLIAAAIGSQSVANAEGRRIEMHATPNDPMFPLQRSFNWIRGFGPTDVSDTDIDAPEAWDVRTDASSVIVAVIDSGIDLAHPDLASNLWRNPGEIPGNRVDDDLNGYVDDVNGFDFLDRDALPDDESGHGTHLAGIVGAVGNDGFGVTGVAWRARIMPLKASAPYSNGVCCQGGSTITVFEAVRYAISKGAKVILMSFSSSSSENIQEAVAIAEQAGVLVVAADSAGYPARLTNSNLVTVGWMEQATNASNYYNIDLFAPGEAVSTWPGSVHENMRGSSRFGRACSRGGSPHFGRRAESVPAELSWRFDGRATRFSRSKSARIRRRAASTSLGSVRTTWNQDGDGRIDRADNCPQDANSDQGDFDSDGFGDRCDRGAPPNAVNDSACVVRNSPRRIHVLNNDSDPDHAKGSLMVIAPWGARANGTLSRWETDQNVVVFTPKTGYLGTASFRYTLVDPVGNVSREATVSLEVKASCP
ncbi:MAG: S8 family serine peptidase [Deltaproteobacteria bacterium]|nr:S8 family serine peptidase [Deltaproteobacteria bacterium]